MMIKTMLVVSGLLLLASTAMGETHVLIVNGISRDPADRMAKERVIQDLQASLLSHGGVDSDRLTVLMGDNARADNIARALTTMVSNVGREDRFIFWYVGQANAVGESLRFNVPGDDFTGKRLASWFNRIKSKTQLVVLDCPHAAMVVKEITGPNRILAFASTEEQAYGTRLSLHLAPALKDKDRDTNADGCISVLEAFTAAARGIEQWYRDNEILPTETPNLEDNADGVPSERPWRYLLDGGDGAAASQFILATL